MTYQSLNAQPQWNGVSGVEIAATLKRLANFLLSKNVGNSVNETMQSWLSQGGIIEQLSQATNDDKLDELLNTDRPQGYWPGRLTPTLIELSELLEFLAYRDTIEQVCPSEVQSILSELNAFKAFEGSCHCAATSHHHDTSAFINAMLRHPSEVYAYTPTAYDASDNPNVKYGNMLFHWSQQSWFPNANGEVVFTMHRGGGQSTKAQRLDYEKELLEAMIRAAGVGEQVGYTVSYFGETYGGDAVEVRLTMEAYHNIFLRALWENDNQHAVKTGYIAGKYGFIFNDDLYVPEGYNSEKLAWLFRTGYVEVVNSVQVPGYDFLFQKIVFNEPWSFDGVIDDVEYKSLDLGNAIRRTRGEIVLEILDGQMQSPQDAQMLVFLMPSQNYLS